MGQIMLTGSKGSWAQFVFVYRSHSARELYYALDQYSAADLRFAIDLYTKGFEKSLRPNLSSSARELYSAPDLYSAADLHSVVDCFHLHLFLWIFLALWSFWWVFGPCFSLDFPPYGPLGMDSKNGHQQTQQYMDEMPKIRT